MNEIPQFRDESKPKAIICERRKVGAEGEADKASRPHRGAVRPSPPCLMVSIWEYKTNLILAASDKLKLADCYNYKICRIPLYAHT
jgi:hypothetical protein